MREQLRVAGVASFLLLGACGGPGEGARSEARAANAAVGTWNVGGPTPSLALIFWANLSSPTSPDGFVLRVEGPQGLSKESDPTRSDTVGPLFFWKIFPNDAAVAGRYTLSASFPGNANFSRQMELNPANTLPQPQNVSLQVAGNTATISWNPVPGARSYYVEIQRLGPNNEVVGADFVWYTNATRLELSLSRTPLPPGNYRAGIAASNVDFVQLRSPNQAAQLDPQFALASAPGPAIQVQSHRIVPLE
ncbi:hypothetical protein DV704_08350 [Meiothermus sp. QL-1]|uniref:hypothetical protein n=1 Tax=Meiothermus sp. QL-1 TaxID=2058095 RepID=UPI000E0B2FF0|nr:hypothetical protein [Meiothermus sp. QL-1]RDI95074.1 hypothetical protein DV704_08350 [Meiothermus sp. QL-1]